MHCLLAQSRYFGEYEHRAAFGSLFSLSPCGHKRERERERGRERRLEFVHTYESPPLSAEVA
jgi:hypothetical protein